MALLVLLVLAGATGFVSYSEATKFETVAEKRFYGMSPKACAGAGFLVGLLVAFIAAPVVLGALIGYAGYSEAVIFERQFRERVLDVSPVMWAVASFVVGLFGALLTSPLACGVVCTLAGLGGALFLAVDERNTLRAEKEKLLAEKSALLTEKTTLLETRPARPAAPAAPAPETGKRRTLAAWGNTPARAEAVPAAAAPARQGWGEPARTNLAGGNDFLPRR
jgi:hypothetical protein